MNRNDFPILNQNVYNKPLVYFDNAATTQKPLSVIEALSDYYRSINSNIHRGVHFLSQKATEEFEVARKAVQQFIHALLLMLRVSKPFPVAWQNRRS